MNCERLVPWHVQQRSLDTKEGAEDEAAALTPAQGPPPSSLHSGVLSPRGRV